MNENLFFGLVMGMIAFFIAFFVGYPLIKYTRERRKVDEVRK